MAFTMVMAITLNGTDIDNRIDNRTGNNGTDMGSGNDNGIYNDNDNENGIDNKPLIYSDCVFSSSIADILNVLKSSPFTFGTCLCS